MILLHVSWRRVASQGEEIVRRSTVERRKTSASMPGFAAVPSIVNKGRLLRMRKRGGVEAKNVCEGDL